jgi:hypothetical protein
MAKRQAFQFLCILPFVSGPDLKEDKPGGGSEVKYDGYLYCSIER